MRSILYALFAAISILLSVSCTNVHDNYGFPSKVKFSKDGGKIVIYGNGPVRFDGFDIFEGSKTWYGNWHCTGSGSLDGYGSCTYIVNSDWLKIINTTNTDSIVFIATPNNSGKKRKAYTVPAYNGNCYAVINIHQDK